jgi:hypothetical protein
VARDGIEAVLAAALLVACLAPLVASIWRPRRAVLWTGVGVAWPLAAVLFALLGLGFRGPRIPEWAVPNRPVQIAEPGFTSSKTCEACHPREYDTWRHSYHRTMTQVATLQTAKGDFSGVDLELQGKRYRLGHTGESLWVELDEPGWQGPGAAPRVRRQVVMSTGSHHDQNYWYEGGQGDRRLSLLPFDYSLRERRWVPFRSTFVLPPDREASDPIGLWNQNCYACHTTRGVTSLRQDPSRPDGLDFETMATEFGIACEACHGPAAEHVRRNQNPVRRLARYVGLAGEADPTIVNPARLDHQRSAQVCGSCHGIFEPRESVQAARAPGAVYDPWIPGKDIDATRVYFQHRYTDPHFATHDRERHETILKLQREVPPFAEGRTWSDGMVCVSGRDYSAMIESPCFERGELDCLSCHRMHREADDPRPLDEWANDQLETGMDGNAACLDCHPRFASDEALVAHTHHPADSPGSTCYNCHMPYTVYGIQKAIRSHHIDVPSVQASLDTGRPNACNQCHLDRTLAWAARSLNAWYGQPEPALSDDQREVAASVLWALTGQAGQRALMAWSFGWDAALEASGSEWMRPLLGQLLADPYDSVRFIAYHSLRQHAGFEDFPYDFVVPGDEQHDAVFRARLIWSQRGTLQQASARPEVLQEASGDLDFKRFHELLQRRNDTPVSLFE